ncbi:DUF1922 domain-containing protein [Candidatus Bathyarchaeota archaeon]|nr:DUF1922 domain-containing protein [Candidatus Bathyarchaeota archaeon]
MYLIARCPSCGKHMMANSANRTRTCPHCGSKSSLQGLRIIARAESSQDAVRIIQRLKEGQSEEGSRPSFKRFKV